MVSSSDSEDDRLRGARRVPPNAPPVPKKTYIIKNSTMQKRKMQCSRWMRNKWFIAGMSALILLIILAIVLGVTLGKKSPPVHVEPVHLMWWQNATIYRCYVTSYADSDGDGLGDFKGLQERLPYLKDLGIDVLWLSPIQYTNTVTGTDVTDIKSVKVEYGQLQDFRELVISAKLLGIKVIMDIILNHSGSAHTWFKESQSSTPSFKDYYIWSKGKTGSDGKPLPPNNWVSMYNGSAWQWSDLRQEYYLRQFWKNEPDLNYRQPQIIQEMKNAANFWLDKGVNGFHVRDAAFLYEDAQLTDESQLGNTQDYASFSHNFTRDLPESYQAINDIFASIMMPRLGEERILLVEANERVMSDERWSQTYQSMTTNVLYKLNSTFDGLQLKALVNQSLEAFNKTRSWPTWTLGDETRSRIYSKFNQLAIGLQMIQIFLPGSSSIYYGEELQFTNNAAIKYGETVDTAAQEAGPINYSLISRDPFRTPMKWNSSRHAGFTSAENPWLPVNNNDPTVDILKSRSNSLWNTIKDMIVIKKTSLALTNGTIDFPIVDTDIFSFTRVHAWNNTGFLIVWNVGSQRKTLSFYNTTYISNDMTVIRKIKTEGSRTETSLVKKSDVTVEPKEIAIFSFWKQ
ncbi:hypothetical protein OUZ56_013285 [Daphnia magna]|uniref:alpha-glucosidase n=1 Tax=Daphnia magna TaxID=35525 RepID=A0ABQ9Z5F9_9CRUS|nr:hypothetical protein OUZ56_013285 [Daphnia magna]